VSPSKPAHFHRIEVAELRTTAAFEGLFTLTRHMLLTVSFLLGFSASAQGAIVISGVQITVAVDDTVTVTNQGTSEFFGDVGTAGNYPFLNGWGVSSGTITWRDTNNNIAATLSSGGMNIPASGRVANSNGSKTGSVTLTLSSVGGAGFRSLLGGGGVSTFTQPIAVNANGSVDYRVEGTVSVLVNNATILQDIDLDVNSNTDVVTVVYSGDAVGFGGVGRAGRFSLMNGWQVASDSRTWFDAGANVAATLFAAGVDVPVGGRIATSNTTGSHVLAGSTTLGAALESQFGDGTWAFTSLAAKSHTTNFWFAGSVTVPEPPAALAGSCALLVLVLLRAGARYRRPHPA
jgi:hypothetical protein